MPTGAITQYDLIGKVEDVSDIITNISPAKTPFQTIIGSESITQVSHTWQEDSLIAAADDSNVEGIDAPTAVSNATQPRSNNTQIYMKTAQATETARATKTYGRGDELSYQTALRATEMKRNLEVTLVKAKNTGTIGSSSVARKMNGYQKQLDTSVYLLNGAVPRALTESLVLTMGETLYNQGAEPDTLMIKPADAKIVAAFQSATGRTKYYTADQKKVVNAVDYYESPYGVTRVVMNRFQATADALMFEPGMWKKLTLRDWNRKTMAVTGDATKVLLVGEFSLKHRNYFASGAIGDLS